MKKFKVEKWKHERRDMAKIVMNDASDKRLVAFGIPHELADDADYLKAKQTTIEKEYDLEQSA